MVFDITERIDHTVDWFCLLAVNTHIVIRMRFFLLERMMFYICLQKVHVIIYFKEKPIRYFWIKIHIMFLIINFNLYNDHGERICLQEKPTKLPVNGEAYQSIFIDLFHLKNGIHQNLLRRRIMVYQLLSSLGQECKKNNLTEQFSELIPALEYIQSNPIVSIQVNDLIKACYISPTKFRKQFQKCEGISPQVYLDRMTLDAACRLLESTQLSFSDISIRLGFSSPANFTKYFKKHKFITPTEYRKLYFQHIHAI